MPGAGQAGVDVAHASARWRALQCPLGSRSAMKSSVNEPGIFESRNSSRLGMCDIARTFWRASSRDQVRPATLLLVLDLGDFQQHAPMLFQFNRFQRPKGSVLGNGHYLLVHTVEWPASQKSQGIGIPSRTVMAVSETCRALANAGTLDVPPAIKLSMRAYGMSTSAANRLASASCALLNVLR